MSELAGVIDDLCHVLGVGKQLITRITIFPGRVVVDRYEPKALEKGLESLITQTFYVS